MSNELAITERKSHIKKVGGCVGIFFQLFDWNRRFTNKKFFPKKLINPGRTRVSKKFNADEKLPLLPVTKHLMIADENSGGFQSKMKKKNGDCNFGLGSKKHEMKAPGLVARLMGLEAMPVVVDESAKSCSKDDFKGKGGEFSGGMKSVELSPEKTNVRPQKLQKTGVSERKSVTRFSAEAFQIKNVLSRSRKHQYNHPKLLSPVKSPKMGRSTSRLIDAAARFLEPGIQASNRARCSLTYPSSSGLEPFNEDVMNEVKERMEIPVPNVEHGCRSCGNVFERVDTREYELNNGRGLNESRPRPVVYLENENDVVLLKPRYQPECSQPDSIPVNRIFTSQKDASRSTGYNNSRSQRPGKMLVGDRVPQKSKVASAYGRRVTSPPPVNKVTEAKDFIALNRNISRSRLRGPNKPESSFEGDRLFQTGKNDSLQSQRNPVRKRRTLPANSTTSGSSPVDKRRSDKALVVNQSGPKARPASQRGNKDTKSADVASFAFNSPVKRSPVKKSHNEIGVRRRDAISSVNEDSLEHEPSRSYLGLNGDALGALLEQKLKELTSQVENEAVAGFTPSARTTASILQELISALTTDQPMSSERRGREHDRKDLECNDIFDSSSSQVNSRSKRSSDGISRGVDHFSPGYVLDASFSNESCVSSSIDDNSVKLAPDDAVLSDSASSTNQTTRRNDIMVVSDLVTHTSAILEDINCVHAKLTATKRAYMQDIVLNAELLFGNAAGLHSSSRFIDFLLGPFLDELETLVIAAWKNNIILGIEVKKEENPLRKFLLDCLIECLDVKYIRYINSGFRTWRRLPKSMNAEVLIKEFDEEVRKWISFAGNTPDEIIEKDMSISFGKWTDFELDAFENGVEINEGIVQSLVDEIVTDLCDSQLNLS